MRTMILVIAVAMLAGCADAKSDGSGALGTTGTIKCYSGGKIIYEGAITGKLIIGNSFTFYEANTGKRIHVRGDCVVEY